MIRSEGAERPETRCGTRRLPRLPRLAGADRRSALRTASASRVAGGLHVGRFSDRATAGIRPLRLSGFRPRDDRHRPLPERSVPPRLRTASTRTGRLRRAGGGDGQPGRARMQASRCTSGRLGLDQTRFCRNERRICVAAGRDHADVPPTCGCLPGHGAFHGGRACFRAEGCGDRGRCDSEYCRPAGASGDVVSGSNGRQRG